MKLKDAAIRGLRSGIQAFVGVVLPVLVAPVASLEELKATGLVWAYGLIFAVSTGVLAFLQNLAEDNTGLSLPK